MRIKFNVKADVPNANGVVYPKAVLQKMFDEYSKQDHKYGTLKYGNSWDVRLDEIAFKVRSVNEESDEFEGEIEILDTPAGKQLEKELDCIPEKYRLCTCVTCNTMTDDKKDNILIVKDDARIDYVVLIPKEDCA